MPTLAVNRKLIALAATATSLITTLAQTCFATDLSPSNWPTTVREDAEQRELAGISPKAARSLSGKSGVIVATASPIAVDSGIEALKNGGNAADAAATVALTQVTTQLGSVVSFAGVMSLIYYDAKAKKVYSMDAGYNSYLHEADAKSIPVSDMDSFNSADKTKNILDNNVFRPPTIGGDKGRETLVPGFMAGIEAMHKLFGKLPFPDLFQPAIYYADHGTVINSSLQYFFQTRQKLLARTAEGQQFIRQAGDDLPKLGDRYLQPQVAATLRSVAQDGAKYMYTGAWGQHFVKTIQGEGGKVSAEDMSRYRVIWSEPLSTTYLGHEVYTVGTPSRAAYHILTGLNLAEVFKLEEHGNSWQDPTVLCDFQRISHATDEAPKLDEEFLSLLRSKGIDCSPASQLSKRYARAIVPLLNQLGASATSDGHHTNSIVVIDKEGNIAAISHSINTVIWGGTGIVVDGIPIPDSAGFQQEVLALLKPGDRIPNNLMETIVFKDKKPVLATSAIGGALFPETLRIIVGIIGKKADLATLQAAPPVLVNFVKAEPGSSAYDLGVVIAKGSYDEALVKGLEGLHAKVKTIPTETANALRGTVTAVTIDPLTEEKRTVETPGVFNFAVAY